MENENYYDETVLLIIGLLVFIVSPIDLVPGPIDDIILLFAAIISGGRQLTDKED